MHLVSYMRRSPKMLIYFNNESSKKNSYECRAYESVNDGSLS